MKKEEESSVGSISVHGRSYFDNNNKKKVFDQH